MRSCSLACAGNNFDGDELLLALTRDLTRDVRELLHVVVPCPEDGHRLREQPLEGLVRGVEQPV